MDRKEFINLSTEEVAQIVRAHGPQSCVLSIDGTHRWFSMEHGREIYADPQTAYLDITTKSQIELYDLCFSHGITTLVLPMFQGELLTRAVEDVQLAMDGVTRLANHPDFLSFYQKHKVKVHFFGDYVRELADTQYAYLGDMFTRASHHTANNAGFRLFYGIFAGDAAEVLVQLSLHFYQKTGHTPTRRQLIELYYGEYIDKINMFIGFEKFNLHAYPLIGTGEESLYLTAAPSLYLNQQQLREILYDHIYLRPRSKVDYQSMAQPDFEDMRSHYEQNRQNTFGLGQIRSGIWYPKISFQE